MTASTDAATAAGAAMAAVANLATMQTGATAGGLAYEAHTAAGKAMMAYLLAKEASEAAAETEEVTAAVEARILAEAAMADAVTYGTTAMEKAGEAETAAMAELMIVGTVKTVGGTDLDAAAGSTVVKTGEGAAEQTVETGLIESMNPDTTGDGTPVVVGVPEDANTEVAFKAHVAGAAERTFDIGKVVDSTDDTARLLIIDQYAGTKTVDVYAINTAIADPLMVTRASSGALTTIAEGGGTPITLKSAGMRYLATELNMAGTGKVPWLRKPPSLFRCFPTGLIPHSTRIILS